MLELDALRERAALLDDGAATMVSGRWLRQVLAELSAARAQAANALDFADMPAIDLKDTPSGPFSALIATQRSAPRHLAG